MYCMHESVAGALPIGGPDRLTRSTPLRASARLRRVGGGGYVRGRRLRRAAAASAAARDGCVVRLRRRLGRERGGSRQRRSAVEAGHGRAIEEARRRMDFPGAMDPVSSYKLDVRIISNRARFSSWYRHSTVVDSDLTNFKDLMDDTLKIFPCGYGDVVKLFYFCAQTKSNIEIRTDQDLLAMFAKHKSTKTCFLSFDYHDTSSEPPIVPLWKKVDVPCTPSIAASSQICPTQTQTESQPETQVQPEDQYLLNPEPENEHVGVDEEGLYIEIGEHTEGSVDPSADFVKKRLCLNLTLKQPLTPNLTLIMWRMREMLLCKTNFHNLSLK
ncbi:hypothetical protein U9M48_021561 [Paspalum notatum var. saurae]|uniref:PB1 domain-containing protein n=1 Tax=Paspalum notatum var. saurae TaxID=547442 RepID=A0AAQ3WT22_PASNO